MNAGQRRRARDDYVAWVVKQSLVSRSQAFKETERQSVRLSVSQSVFHSECITRTAKDVSMLTEY